jgi:hypothetical protein
VSFSASTPRAVDGATNVRETADTLLPGDWGRTSETGAGDAVEQEETLNLVRGRAVSRVPLSGCLSRRNQGLLTYSWSRMAFIAWRRFHMERELKFGIFESRLTIGEASKTCPPSSRSSSLLTMYRRLTEFLGDGREWTCATVPHSVTVWTDRCARPFSSRVKHIYLCNGNASCVPPFFDYAKARDFVSLITRALLRSPLSPSAVRFVSSPCPCHQLDLDVLYPPALTRTHFRFSIDLHFLSLFPSSSIFVRIGSFCISLLSHRQSLSPVSSR